MGAIEVEYEGTEEFLRDHLPDFLTTISELHAGSGERDAYDEQADEPRDNGKSPASIYGTTATLAGKLKCTSGPDLAIAAAARLTLGVHQDSFTRQNIHAEMKSARSYYKQNMTSNLSKILEGLVKAGKFNEISKDTYSLAQTERDRIEAILGNI